MAKQTIKPAGFQAGSRDVKVVTDVYASEIESKINDIVGDNPVLQQAVDFVTDNVHMPDVKDITSGIKHALDVDGGHITFDFSEASKRISQSCFSGGLGSLANNVKERLSSNILDSGLIDDLLDNTDLIGETTGLWMEKGIAQDIKILKNGVETFIKGDPSEVSSIFELVGKFTGVSNLTDYFDLGAQVGVVKTVMDFATKYGLPDLADDVIDKFKERDENKKYLDSLLEKQALTAARRGDVRSVDKWISKMGAGRASKIGDVIIEQLLRNYKRPDENVSKVTHANELIATLNKIDPSWNKADYDQSVISLKNYSHCNREATDILYNSTEHLRYVAVASANITETKESSISDILKNSFPNAY